LHHQVKKVRPPPRATLLRMGEQTTRVTFDAKTIRDIGRVIGAELAKALDGRVQPTVAAEPLPAATVETPGVHIEPWTIFGPREQATMAAYVDDAGQQRWVRADREHEVPQAWRKLYRAAS
jgi:hypothetical protein